MEQALIGLDSPFSGWMKGLPGTLATRSSSQDVADLGLNLLAEDLPLPCAVLRSSALDANERWMRRFAATARVVLCPHGKTTMSPELFARQLAGGAWGLTAATLHQARVMRACGVARILYANQLIGRAAIEWAVKEIRGDRCFDFYCLVDSIAGIAQLSGAVRDLDRPLQVLLELGQTGARTGVRSVSDALAVAEVIDRTPGLALAGLETYEYVVAGTELDEREANIRRLLSSFVELALELDRRGLFQTAQIVLSAGGSAYVDLAARAVTAVQLSRPVVPVIRSGCYLTFDHGWLPAHWERMRKRSPWMETLPEGPVPALEVWGHVQSRPEPTSAFLALGKRDVSHDVHLPQPKWWYRRGSHVTPQPVGAELQIVSLNDQHAYLKLPENSPLAVGDLIGVGISHPCTTFDKWRALSIVDDLYNVTGAVSTWF